MWEKKNFMAQRRNSGSVVDSRQLLLGPRHLLNVRVILVTLVPGVRDVEVQSINLLVVQQIV